MYDGFLFVQWSDGITANTFREYATLTTPDRKWVVTANNNKILKKQIDQCSQRQDIIFDFRAQIEGTGSRSEVSRVNIV